MVVLDRVQVIAVVLCVLRFVKPCIHLIEGAVQTDQLLKAMVSRRAPELLIVGVEALAALLLVGLGELMKVLAEHPDSFVLVHKLVPP